MSLKFPTNTNEWTLVDEQRWQFEQEEPRDYVLSTLSRYANTKQTPQERYKAWFAPIEEAEYYLSKGRAYERPTAYASRREEKAHGSVHLPERTQLND